MNNQRIKIAEELRRLGITQKLSGYSLIVRAIELGLEGVSSIGEIYDTLSTETSIPRRNLINLISYCVSKTEYKGEGNGYCIYELVSRISTRPDPDTYSNNYSSSDIIAILNKQEELNNALRNACADIAERTNSCPYEEHGVCTGNKECKNMADCFYRYYRAGANSIQEISVDKNKYRTKLR